MARDILFTVASFCAIGLVLTLFYIFALQMVYDTRRKKAAIIACLKNSDESLRAYDLYVRLRPHVGPWEIYQLCRALERSGDLVSSEVTTAAITLRGDRPVVVYRLAEKHQ